MRLLLKSACVLATLAIGGVVHADIGPVYCPDNGHYYHLVQTNVLWDEANSLASKMTWDGLPGHLATITSPAESQFIFDGLGGPFRYKSWIGGYQWPQDTQDPAANWFWVTGEPWDYTTWAPNAPNDAAGGEFFLDLYWDTPLNNWNDAGFQGNIEAYLVEYEEAVTPATSTSWGRLKGLYRSE